MRKGGHAAFGLQIPTLPPVDLSWRPASTHRPCFLKLFMQSTANIPEYFRAMYYIDCSPNNPRWSMSPLRFDPKTSFPATPHTTFKHHHVTNFIPLPSSKRSTPYIFSYPKSPLISELPFVHTPAYLSFTIQLRRCHHTGFAPRPQNFTAYTKPRQSVPCLLEVVVRVTHSIPKAPASA